MRILIDELGGRVGETDLDADDLVEVYRPLRSPWWRINMVSTVDGSATGASGRSGSINNGADKAVFDTLRALADAILVGAGTARDEGYGPAEVPIVLVSRRGHVPESLRDAPRGSVLLATTTGAEGLAESRAALGEENVIVTGDEVDLAALRGRPRRARPLVGAVRGRPEPVRRPGRGRRARRGVPHRRAAAGRGRAPAHRHRPRHRDPAPADHPARAGRHPARALVRRATPG